MPDTKFLTYKDKPLVRKGNEIYYGSMEESFIVRFEILSSDKSGNIELANKVKIELLKSDIELPMSDRIVKQSTKNSMFEALDVGFVWLERALKD